MTSPRQHYTHEIPPASRGYTWVRCCGFQRKRQQAGKQGLASDSEAGSRLRGWRIGVPFSTAAASTSSTAAGASPTALANRRECMLSTWRCQAKSPRLITRLDHVSAGFASYVSLRIYLSHSPLRHCDSFRMNDRLSRALSAIVGSEPWLCHSARSLPDAPRSYAPSDQRAAHPPSSSA